MNVQVQPHATTTRRHLPFDVRPVRRRRERRIPIERQPSEKVTRVRLGSYELKKKGVSLFDLRDPYHLAVELTWSQFLTALLALYLLVNVVFATLFWLVPRSVANARPGSLAAAFFFSTETFPTVAHGHLHPPTLTA